MNTGTEEVMRKQLRHQANGVISVQSLPSNVLVSNIHLQHSEGGSEISFNALHKYHKRSNSSLTSSMGDTNSLSTTSSYKIHRSNSGSSAHAACSFENLRLKAQTERLNNISMRNQSFHAHSRSRLYSTTKSTSMANETFSIVEKGRLSSNPLLNTMLTSPSSNVGSTAAAAKFIAAVQKSRDSKLTSTKYIETASTDRLNNISMRHRFDAHSSGQYSTTKSTTMANETFSIVSIDSTRQRCASFSTMNGRLTSNPLLGTIQSSNTGSATAAAKFVMAVQKSRDCHETASVVLHKPIQVQAEEYAAPAIIDRTMLPPTNLETGIISAVPDCIEDKFVRPSTPLDIVKKSLASRGFSCNTKPSMDMENGYFVNLTDMYDQEMVTAIRSNDIECLTKLHASGINLQCGNRFGETLIHLACRRSSNDLVSYLINDASVSLRVRDDFGRTPAHDACWRAEANLPLLEMLLDQAPELLMLTDKRGHTPLCYSRREHWGVLIPFLEERIDKFRAA